MSAEVLGKITFLETPDVNGSSLVLTLSGTTDQISTSQTADVGTIGLASNPIIPGTAALRLPVGTTAQRSGSPGAGDTRFNTDLDTVEAYMGTAWVQQVGVLDKSTTDVTFTTQAGGNLVSFSVPANTLGTNRILRVTLEGTFTYTATARQIQIGVTYGGTTMWADSTANITSGNTFGWSMTFHVIANGATNAQKLTGKIFFGMTGTPTTGTVGEMGTVNSQIAEAAVYGTAAVNSTNAQTLNVTFAMSGTITTLAMIKRMHIIELL